MSPSLFLSASANGNVSPPWKKMSDFLSISLIKKLSFTSTWLPPSPHSKSPSQIRFLLLLDFFRLVNTSSSSDFALDTRISIVWSWWSASESVALRRSIAQGRWRRRRTAAERICSWSLQRSRITWWSWWTVSSEGKASNFEMGFRLESCGV